MPAMKIKTNEFISYCALTDKKKLSCPLLYSEASLSIDNFNMIGATALKSVDKKTDAYIL
jgi:hypothetical protein